MDLREKIAEALYEAPDELVADSAFGPIARNAAMQAANRRTDAVMEVVEADVERRRAYYDQRIEWARQDGEHAGDTEAHKDMAEAAPSDDLELIRGRVGDMARDLRWDLDGHEEDQIIEDLIGCVTDVLGAKHRRVRELEEEAVRLRHELAVARGETAGTVPTWSEYVQAENAKEAQPAPKRQVSLETARQMAARKES